MKAEEMISKEAPTLIVRLTEKELRRALLCVDLCMDRAESVDQVLELRELSELLAAGGHDADR